MKIERLSSKDGFILSEEEKPCLVCGKPTKQIEIHFECRICSGECCIKLCNEYLLNTSLD